MKQLLALCVIAALAACGSGGQSQQNSSTSQAVEAPQTIGESQMAAVQKALDEEAAKTYFTSGSTDCYPRGTDAAAQEVGLVKAGIAKLASNRGYLECWKLNARSNPDIVPTDNKGHYAIIIGRFVVDNIKSETVLGQSDNVCDEHFVPTALGKILIANGYRHEPDRKGAPCSA